MQFGWYDCAKLWKCCLQKKANVLYILENHFEGNTKLAINHNTRNGHTVGLLDNLITNQPVMLKFSDGVHQCEPNVS